MEAASAEAAAEEDKNDQTLSMVGAGQLCSVPIFV